MYTEHFGLKENPFSITPDPHYFYVSDKHREALAHLMYGFTGKGGFVLLTGEVGTGKTTVCRRLLERAPEGCEIAFILYPRLTADELLSTICDEFGIKYPPGTTSSKELVTRIYEYLLETRERGKRAVVIIEEAQNLSDEVLEQIRLLTNLETNKEKLLQIIMLGQPELRQKLAQPHMRQLSQRVTARYHLNPLSRKEIPAYIAHRLKVAGLPSGQLFPGPVARRLFRLTGGVPRSINVICDRALVGTFIEGKERVDAKTLTKAARELAGDGVTRRPGRLLYGMAVILILALLIGGLGMAYRSGVIMKSEASATRDMIERTGEGPSLAPYSPGMQAAGGGPVKPVRSAEGLDRPGGYTGARTRESAHRALAREWQAAYDAESALPFCQQVAAQGLTCFNAKDSLDVLRHLNRPAVLRLKAGRKGEYYGTLVSISPDTATVILGDEARIIGVKDIGRWWSGEYMVLFRRPPSYKEEIKWGERGTFISWIEKQLASRESRTVRPVREQVYDAEMARQIREFQAASGLVPDGLIGPKTVMLLADRADNNEPRLND
jgi:general secretion pathway protein A